MAKGKKPRSAAQKAATAKMVAANKAKAKTPRKAKAKASKTPRKAKASKTKTPRKGLSLAELARTVDGVSGRVDALDTKVARHTKTLGEHTAELKKHANVINEHSSELEVQRELLGGISARFGGGSVQGVRGSARVGARDTIAMPVMES